jgi:succinate dehydrogenase/fumarate reductase flavoprotein subunit
MDRQEELFDVVVVGAGGAGLAAAIEARACDASVPG